MSWENEIKKVSFRNILGSLQEIGGLLVKRGTAMGPLVPSLLLCPAFLLFAWLLRSEAVVSDIPLISAALVLAGFWIVFDYHRHYARFARNDPDRLQSEEYRYQTTRVMIAAKGLPLPVPAEELSLSDPAANLSEPEPDTPVEQSIGSTDADEEHS